MIGKPLLITRWLQTGATTLTISVVVAATSLAGGDRATLPGGGKSATDVSKASTSETQHAAATYSYVPSTAELNSQLLPLVQRGYTLAQRGASYAAQNAFVEVLRRVAEAKDAASGSAEHSHALAAGLQALDEAEDFIPQGRALDADIDMRLVVSSHRTPILSADADKTSPRVAIGLYHRYAQEKLASAVAGERVGSMALYGLGKIAQQYAQRTDSGAEYVQTEMTMYAAALAACSDNYLAANELGVCLCKSGQPGEAARIFEHTIDVRPNSTAYHNLAIAQQKLGFLGQAAANEQESQRLALSENAPGVASRRAGIEWISPNEMSGIAQSTEFPANVVGDNSASTRQQAGVAVGKNEPQPPSWQRIGRLANVLPLHGLVNHAAAASQAETGGAGAVSPVAAGQNRWR